MDTKQMDHFNRDKVLRVFSRSMQWLLRFLILYLVSKAISVSSSANSRHMLRDLYSNGFLVYFLIIIMLDFIEVFSVNFHEKILVFSFILTLLVVFI